MKILVTGCAGFIGSWLSEELLKLGYDVIGIDCFTNYYSPTIKRKNIVKLKQFSNFEFINKDITKMKIYPKVDIVLHLAAQPGVRSSWGENFNLYIKNNILSTQKLLEFYKNNKNIEKFVYISSSSVYGNTKLPMKETTALNPISPYGATKHCAENLVKLYHENYNLNYLILRYFTVYGPKQRPDMAIFKFIKSGLTGKEITIYGQGKYERDFIYIKDVVEATIKLIESDIINEIFNIGSGKSYKIIEILKTIEKLLKRKLKIKYLNQQKGDVNKTLAEISKIKEHINWEPMTPIEEGIKCQIEWMKSFFQL